MRSNNSTRLAIFSSTLLPSVQLSSPHLSKDRIPRCVIRTQLGVLADPETSVKYPDLQQKPLHRCPEKIHLLPYYRGTHSLNTKNLGLDWIKYHFLIDFSPITRLQENLYREILSRREGAKPRTEKATLYRCMLNSGLQQSSQ